MGKIHVLSSEISNRIAAGEVVERPASVVKELVENSIDAGADSICVEIKKGGVAYIRVTDNGSGMTEEDARTAFLRHATSKIQTENDLDAIYTLGFRGEALSSIGAVSSVKLYTKTEGGEGILAECEGGEIRSSKDAGTPVGTTFIVQNLFFNTPARMKFLKKDSTEGGYIADIMGRFILAHPDISFRLIDSGKDRLFSPGDGSLVNAVYTVYGRDYARAVLSVDYTNGGITVSGAVGKSEASRPNRSFQSYFVNGRYVKSPLIIRAVEEAYKNQIMIGKFPMAALNVKINPSLIDINVHPTKLEVKFSNEKAVYDAVYFAVKNALYSTVNIPQIWRVPDTEKAPEAQTEKIQPQQTYMSEPQEAQPPKRMEYSEPVREKQNAEQKVHTVSETAAETASDTQDTAHTKPVIPEEYFEKLKQSIISNPGMQVSEVRQVTDELKLSGQQKLEEQTQNGYRIIGQLFSTYILIERGNELLICDQHAAHERIRYEQLLKETQNASVSSQMLISPSVVTLSAGEYESVFENAEFFQSAGFEIEEFGTNTVAVRAVPTALADGDVADMISEMAAQLALSKREVITESRQRALYSAACKSAVKANRSMSETEMKKLLDDVFMLENINTCPHGRPIIVSMTKKEIEKEFKRIV